jgi:type IV secretory pathway VirJ component
MKKIFISILLLSITRAFAFPVEELKSVQQLPLELSGFAGTKNPLVIYLTGDGGWNSFSRKLVQEFEKGGYGVVSLNTRKYFRKKQTPDNFANDIASLSDYYMKKWEKTSVIIVGYSFGADVAAFLPRRLPLALLEKMDHIALLSPSASSDFVIKLTDLIGDSRNIKRKYKVGRELNESTFPVVCIFGKTEDLKLKSSLDKKESLTIHVLPGNHQYNNNLPLIVRLIGL